MRVVEESPMSIAQLAQQFEPIFITAPTARNGVTLLQRLLNSTGRILVYGENRTLFDVLPALAINLVHMQQIRGSANVALRERIRGGDTEFWSSEVNPPLEQLVVHAIESFFSLVKVYENSAKQDGFARWGMKNPMPQSKSVHQLCQLLPRAKVIVIFRDPFEAAASAKSRKFLNSSAEFMCFGSEWSAHLAEIRNNPLPQIHLMRYESLLEGREEQLEQLEAFTGLRSMAVSVLDRKFNTFLGTGETGRSPTQYIEPTPLSRDELHALEQGLGAIAEQCGYSNSQVAM